MTTRWLKLSNCHARSNGSAVTCLWHHRRQLPALSPAVRRLVCGLQLLAFLFVGVAPAHAIPPAAERWTKISAPDFTLYSNTDEKKAKRLAGELVAFRTALQAGAAADSARPNRHVTILAFRDDASFQEFRKVPAGKADNIVGEFRPLPLGDYITMTASGDRPARTVLHEYVHSILNASFPNLPLWLHEGMAEFYSTTQVDGDKVEFGHVIPEHVEFLQRFAASSLFLPLPALFQFTARTSGYTEGLLQGAFYAESWLAVHYIWVRRPELRPALDRFVELTAEGWRNTSPGGGPISTSDFFETAFGMPVDAFATELVSYLRAGEFDFRRANIKPQVTEGKVRSETADHTEILFHMGAVLTFAGPECAPSAREHLSAALERAPQHALARAALGTVLSNQGRFTDADAAFDAAIDIARDDAGPFLLYGMSKLRRCEWERTDFLHPKHIPAAAADARGLFGRCLELRPMDAEAMRNIAATYLFDAEGTDQGLQYLDNASRLEPWNHSADAVRIAFLLRRGDRNEAREVRRLMMMNSRDRESLADADALWNQAERLRMLRWEWERDQLREIFEAVGKENYDAALRQSETLAATARDSATAQKAAEIRDRIRTRQARASLHHSMVASAEKTTEDIAQYNRAVDLIRSGEYDAAYELLGRLSVSVADTAIARHVKEALATVRAARERHKR